MNKTFSIFTPCYNSEKIIKRLFDSLQKQTNKDFEWIVIDDVSTDGTRDLLETLIPTADFSINYIKNQTNQMVSKNHDIALENAKGKFFIKLSHDDMLTENALENFLDAWYRFSDEEIARNKIVGVICNCLDKEGNIEGDLFPQDYWVADDYQMRFGRKIKGEKCSITLTEIARKIPFSYPEIDSYVPADLHFYTISYNHKYIYSNKAARIHIVNDGQSVHFEAQIGRGKKFVNGIYFYYKQVFNNFGDKILKYSLLNYLIFLINFIRYGRYGNKSYAVLYSELKRSRWIFLPAVFLANAVEIVKYKSIL